MRELRNREYNYGDTGYLPAQDKNRAVGKMYLREFVILNTVKDPAPALQPGTIGAMGLEIKSMARGGNCK